MALSSLTSSCRSVDLRTTTHIFTDLLHITPTRGLLYAAESSRYQGIIHRFEHLSCFLPGLFALAAQTLPLDDLRSIGIYRDDIVVGAPEAYRRKFRLLSRYSLKS